MFKKLFFSLFSIFLMIASSSAQDVVEGDNTFAFLKDGAFIKVEFDYSGLQVKEVKDSVYMLEADYLAKKKEQYDKKNNSGNEWLGRWNDPKAKKYSITFCKGLNSRLEKRKIVFSDSFDLKDIKLVVAVKKCSLGFFRESTKTETTRDDKTGISKTSERAVAATTKTAIDVELSFVDVATGQILSKVVYSNVDAHLSPFEIFGLNPALSVNDNALDYEYARGIKLCFSRLGKLLGDQIVLESKKNKKK